MLFAPKSDRKLRLCVDYRKLNAVTIKDRYTLPLADEMRNKVQGAGWFTKIDMHWGYYNIHIKAGDEWKTAFRTQYGLYEWLVMPMGLTNAVTWFQRFGDHAFKEFIDKFVIIYLDDILIFSKTEKEHVEHVTKVLEKLEEYDLQAKLEKCFFHQTEIEFLGYIVSGTEIRMSPAKVEAVANWPTPTNKKEVLSFLGFTNFYRKFIHQFGWNAAPISRLMQKEVPFKWTKKQQQCFDKLK